jgi:alcohol dehydrogenase YqhD (iron-dependent ADH family)
LENFIYSTPTVWHFGKGDCILSDRITFSIIMDAMEWSSGLMAKMDDYEARAAIMYDATKALNLITSNGKGGEDWGVHAQGHVLSLLHDVP